jgi:beta-1,4-mannosyl-glycoprotein beta-1,4-N-acetylglucosaminyltransferase
LIKNDLNCAKYGFKPKRSNLSNTSSLPIYDFFLFHDEFDLLEIRLYEIYNYVTLFLIAESRYTLSGKKKPLYLRENWSKFAKYHDKIRRVEIELSRETKSQWDNEHRMRNEGLRVALMNITA